MGIYQKMGSVGPLQAEICLSGCLSRLKRTMLELLPTQCNIQEQLPCPFLIVIDQKMGSIGPQQAEKTMAVVDGSVDFFVVEKSSPLPIF